MLRSPAGAGRDCSVFEAEPGVCRGHSKETCPPTAALGSCRDALGDRSLRRAGAWSESEGVPEGSRAGVEHRGQAVWPEGTATPGALAEC